MNEDPHPKITPSSGSFAPGQLPKDEETLFIETPAVTSAPSSANLEVRETGFNTARPAQEERPRTGLPVIGDILNGRFILKSELGRGGMGVVFLASDLRKEEARDREPFVAVKVLNEAVQKNPDAFIALQRETKKAQRLAHPNIATVYDFDRDGPTVYMTMELLEGESVGQLIKRTKDRGLSFTEAWPIIEGMANGLAYAHKKNIIHSDFKPGNAFIMKTGEVKVLDFGIARAVKPTDQTAGEATVFDPAKLGALTPAYASCEMFSRAEPDPRDDIYALACVSYELLTGRHPFDKIPANKASIRQLKPNPIPELSRKQNKALIHALAFERLKRTPSVPQFLSELAGHAEAKSATRGWVGAVVLTFGVMSAGVGAWLYLDNKNVLPVSVPAVPSREVSKDLAPVPVTEQSTVSVTGPVEQIDKPAEILVEETRLDAESQAKVERILEVADLHLEIGRLIEPKGSNAVEAYRAVLSIHPTNKRAKAGLEKIASHFEGQAQQALGLDKTADALLLVKQALLAVPNDPRLGELKNRIIKRSID